MIQYCIYHIRNVTSEPKHPLPVSDNTRTIHRGTTTERRNAEPKVKAVNIGSSHFINERNTGTTRTGIELVTFHKRTFPVCYRIENQI